MVIKRNGTFLGRMQVNGRDQKCSMKDGTDQIIVGFYKDDGANFVRVSDGHFIIKNRVYLSAFC